MWAMGLTQLSTSQLCGGPGAFGDVQSQTNTQPVAGVCCRVAAANGSVSTDAGAGGAVPWSNVEFHVKWRRLSFIHTSWQPLEALRDLLGFKRVLNYMK